MTVELKTELARADFPPAFVWGAATASYQIEGAVHEDGRSPSIWDTFSHTPGKVTGGDTGDVAADHYFRYKEDVALMRQIGLNAYRFSVAWPRIIPTGSGEVNPKGLDFYDRLVDELLANDIQPYATLYHWDLPQILQDKGGWSNRDTAYYFAEYTEKVVRKLGDRVKGWMTLNEPFVSMALGHLSGDHAPGLRDLPTTVRAGHHLMLGHGLAMPVLRQNASRADAEFGITLSFNYVEAGSPDATEAAVIKDAWDNRMCLEPLFKGRYPAELDEFIQPYLPIEPGDMELIGAPLDFLGVNYYFRTLPVAWKDRGAFSFHERNNPGSEYTGMGWEIYPEGLYKLLRRFHEDYGAPKLYITENGAAFNDTLVEENGELHVHDPERKAYLQAHFQATLQAIHDGAPVAGYFIWSLLDNFEWAYGYEKRFGITYVDYPTQRRVLKDSGLWYHNFLQG